MRCGGWIGTERIETGGESAGFFFFPQAEEEDAHADMRDEVEQLLEDGAEACHQKIFPGEHLTCGFRIQEVDGSQAEDHAGGKGYDHGKEP